MTRKDANKQHDQMSSSMSTDQRLEAEEIESRRALSLSIMHHAVQASNMKGSSKSLNQLSSNQSKAQSSIGSNMESQNMLPQSDPTSTSTSHIEQYFDEEGWNIAEYYTTPASNKLNLTTRNRRSCMYICALIASVIIGVLVGSERLGFTHVQHLEDNMGINSKNGEKVKYKGNYTDLSSAGGTSTGMSSGGQGSTDFTVQNTKTTRSSSKNYKKEPYKVPDNIDETDDFVSMDQVLPTVIDTNLGDVFDEENKRIIILDDMPYFWIVPRNGGNSIRYVLSYCFKSVLACEAGARRDDGDVLEVFEEDGCKYVNVNTESSEGIKRAKELNLVNSGLAYAIFSSRINEIASVFTPDRRGRSFTLLRHPVERAISEYYQEQARNPKLALVSLESYLQDNSDDIKAAVGEDNFITRSLINKPIADLTTYDLDLAMMILKKKFLIGLVDEMEESVKRFRKYFSWNVKGLKGVDECVATFTSPSPRKKPIFSENSNVWKLLEERNKFDVKLFDFALHLFDVQGLYLQKK